MLAKECDALSSCRRNTIIGQGRCTTDPPAQSGGDAYDLPANSETLVARASRRRPLVITRLNAFDCVRLFVRVCVHSVYIQHPRVVVRVAPVRSAFAVRIRLPHVPVCTDPHYSLTGFLSPARPARTRPAARLDRTDRTAPVAVHRPVRYR